MIKEFQKQDLARAALHDGLVLAWDTGLGKTWAAFLWPILKLGYEVLEGRVVPKGSVLLIAPGDLHEQIKSEGLRRFRVPVTIIETHEDFLGRVLRIDPGGQPVLPPGFYIASYQAVAINGTKPLPDVDDSSGSALLQQFSIPHKAVESFFARRGQHWQRHYATLEVTPADSREGVATSYDRLVMAARSWPSATVSRNRLAELERAWEVVSHLVCDIEDPRWSDLDADDRDWVAREFMRQWIEAASAGIGTVRELDCGATSWPIRCVYSPCLADFAWNAFDCVVIDEGARMKGEDTLTGIRVRQFDPKYRLVLTATPVKNRLPDLFRLAWWATGGKRDAHGRWPFSSDTTERDEFAKTFLVSERNLTKEAQSEVLGKRRRFTKLTAEVCNIHRLWKLLAPVVLRRRKQDAGESIVPKTRHVVRVCMGTHQAETYAYHLAAKYVDRNGLPAIGAKLQALRVAASAPNSLLLEPQRNSPKGRSRSSYGYTPKIHAALNLIDRCLRAGEQFVVFSAFHDPLDILSQRLRQVGVIHAVLDGRASPKHRGEVAARFKLGAPRWGRGGAMPGLLAGVECMAEGHDFYLANNVILLSYSWAFDKFEQAINRVHRLLSPHPVNVWSILCDGSIDRKLEASIQEKGDSAELVLDGKLMGERSEELNLAELLATAQSEFHRSATTTDEESLVLEWPALAGSLREAQALWSASSHPAVGDCADTDRRELTELIAPDSASRDGDWEALFAEAWGA